MARILVIDDEYPVRAMLKKVLTEAGYEVIDASNGKVGIDRYRQDPTDLVITDLFMPEKEGLETIQELKREYPEVKIIAISGGGTTTKYNFLPCARALGALRTFPKPFDVHELLKAVKGLLGECV